MCFVNLAELANLEQNEPFSILETMFCRMYSLQSLTQFTQGNYMLHAPAFNTDGFHSSDTCVSSS
jgi:hypothetical protein